MASITAFITCLLSLLPLWVGWASGELCVPNCSEAKEGDKVSDPTNCLQYYYCSDPEGTGVLMPSDQPLTCPEGFYFNGALYVRECEAIVAGLDYCSGLCSPCRIECTSPGTLLADPYDCGSFIVCLDDDILPQSCPADAPNFDYITTNCVNDSSVCYDYCDPCQVYCSTPGKVVDPYDCKSYYLCDPPNQVHFTCPPGDDFNPETQLCEPSSGCTPVC